MRDSIMDYRNNGPFHRDNVLMKCLNCDDSNGLLYHCRDCKDSLCQSCVSAHCRERMTKDHVIWRVDNHSSSLSSSTSSLLSFNSSDNLDEIGTAHNSTRKCSQASDTMWWHNEENRLTITSECTRALRYEADSGDVSQNELQSLVENVDSAYNKWKTTEKEIRALMHMYRMRVDEREKELLNELTASIAVKTASLKSEMTTYKVIQTSYERSMRVLDNVLKHGRPCDILRIKEICDLEIQNARDLQECALFPEEEVVFVPPGTGFLNRIRNMGKITFDESKIPPSLLQKNLAVDESSLLTQSSRSTIDEKSGVSQKLETGDRNVSSPSKSKINAWARPKNFMEGPNPIRAIIPHLMSNPKVARVKSSCAGKFQYKTAGQLQMIIGREGSNDGELSRPWGVCCTNEGNIIIADRSNHRIQIFSPEGKFVRKFGQYGKEGEGCFDRPAGVAVDPRGRIFITDKDNHRIQVFTQDGEFVFMFGKEGNQNGQFYYPWDIAINTVGHVAVTDTRNQRIQMFSNNGSFLRKFGIENVFFQSNNLDSPRGVCFNTEGNLVVTDFNNHRILVIESNFKKAKFLGGPGTGTKQFMRPQGVAVDNKGKIAIADSRNNRIQIINEDGSYVSQFGCGGSEPGQLDRPCGVCFTPDGKIVVVDFGNNRVQIF